MLSIHQSALISALADDHKVLLVAEHTMDADRIGTGWSVPDMGKALVIISPSEEEADKILDDYRDAVHVFSGINAYPLIYRQFKRACKQGCFILNYLETYKYLGFSGQAALSEIYFASSPLWTIYQGNIGHRKYGGTSLSSGRIS